MRYDPAEDMITCSVPLLTLNSETHLEECLESLHNFADVFLLDGNSTDGTLRIAERRGISIYKQVETSEPNVVIRSFTDMRVKGERLARYNWVLYMDSDEFLSPELIRDVRNVLASDDPKRVFSMRKTAIIGKRMVRHSFNPPDYAPHLYHRHSGVQWKPGKLVHEKLIVPPDVRTVPLRGDLYSYFVSTYGEAVRKDDYYLSLTRKKMFAPGQARPAHAALFSLWINFLRSGNITYKSLKMYLRHGFRESLPPQHVWRYVRYHLFICWYCIQKIFVYGAK